MKNNDKALISFVISDLIKNKTIGELINSNNSEVYCKNGDISVRVRIDEYIANITIRSCETSKVIGSISYMSAKDRKIEYIEDIRQKLKDGIKQKDIAYELGISESYVAQLKKELKK